MAFSVTFGSTFPGVGAVIRRFSVFSARTLAPVASPTVGQLARTWASSATAVLLTGSVATAASIVITIKKTVDRPKEVATNVVLSPILSSCELNVSDSSVEPQLVGALQ